MTRYPDLELALRATFRERADDTSTDSQFDAILDRAAGTRQRPAWLAALANPSLRGAGRPAVPTRRMWVFAVVALAAGVLLSVAYFGGPLPMTSPRATASPAATASPLGTPFPYVTGPRRNGKIFFASYEANGLRLHTIDPDGSHLATLAASWGEGGVFAPDGEHIISPEAIFDIDGRDITVLRLPVEPVRLFPVDLSPDGSRFLAHGWIQDVALAGGTPEAAEAGLYSVRVPDWGDIRKVVALGTLDYPPARFSPDGTTVAYIKSNEAGELRLVGADGTGDRALGSIVNPKSLDWSPDGRSILVAAPDGLFIVDATTGSDTRIVAAVLGRPPAAAVWSPDGTRILVKAKVGSLSVYDLLTMDVRGGDVQRVTNTGSAMWFFDWGSHPAG